MISARLFRNIKPFKGYHRRIELGISTHLITGLEKVDCNTTLVKTIHLNFRRQRQIIHFNAVRVTSVIITLVLINNNLFLNDIVISSAIRPCRKDAYYNPSFSI